MARTLNKFKAQLITADQDGNKVKRNFSNVRSDISDDELDNLGYAIQKVVSNETLKGMALTANSSLRLA